MSDPARELPEDDRPALPNDDRPELSDDDRLASPSNPDWRVSADEGADGEMARSREQLKLTTSNDLSQSVPMNRPIAPTRPERPAAPQERSTGPTPWTAAASSVPKIKIEAKPQARGDAEFDLPRRPGRPAPPDEDLAAPLDDEAAPLDGGFPDDVPDRIAPPPAARYKLDEPIWVVALEGLRSNRQVQMIVIASVVALVAVWALWPKGDPGVSLHDLRANAARWDSQSVRIHGRVGEVFNVGAGWAFYLHQGRDTIVVFTRGAKPESRANITVSGSVSTGYLDGMPRQAIFAAP